MKKSEENLKAEEMENPVQLSMQVEEDLPCPNSEEEIEKQIQESEQTVKQMNSKKKKIGSAVFFALNIVLVALILYFQISKEEILPLSELFAVIKPWYVLCVLAVFILYAAFESTCFNILTKKSTKRSRPFLSYKMFALGRYYDNITPLATGEQPFQIMYLKNHGVDASSSIFIPMGKYIINQISWIIFCSVTLIVSISKGFGGSFSVVGIASIVSLSINAALVGFILFLSTSKKVGKKLVVNVLKLLQKLRIVKNYEKQYLKVMKVVSDYQGFMRSFGSDLWFTFKLLVVSILRLVFLYLTPAFIYCCFYDFHLGTMLEVMCISVLIDLAAGIIPLPGGTGFAEISFTALFGAIFGGVVFWAMLMWRVMSYYWPIAQGLGIIIYDYLIGDKKFRWQQKKWELELESEKFKQLQLRNYRKKTKNITKIRSK